MIEKNLTDTNEIDINIKELFNELIKNANKLNNENKDVFCAKLRLLEDGMRLRDMKNQEKDSGNSLIRTINLITNDPIERKKYIEASMPSLTIVPGSQPSHP